MRHEFKSERKTPRDKMSRREHARRSDTQTKVTGPTSAVPLKMIMVFIGLFLLLGVVAMMLVNAKRDQNDSKAQARVQELKNRASAPAKLEDEEARRAALRMLAEIRRKQEGIPIDPRESAEKTAKLFLKHLQRGKGKEAVSMLATGSISKSQFNFHAEQVHRLARSIAEGSRQMAFDQIFVKEPAAVVVVNRKPEQAGVATDIDPIYLVRDGDLWWVLPELTTTSSASQILEPSQAKVFGELESWFEKRLNQ